MSVLVNVNIAVRKRLPVGPINNKSVKMTETKNLIIKKLYNFP